MQENHGLTVKGNEDGLFAQIKGGKFESFPFEIENFFIMCLWCLRKEKLRYPCSLPLFATEEELIHIRSLCKWGHRGSTCY